MQKNKTEERVREIRAQSAGRRKRRARCALILVAAIAVFYGLFNLKKRTVAFLWNTESLTVKNIGISPPQAKTLITGLIELEKRKNLLFLDIDELREKILLIQEVEDCTVKKIYPDTVSIEIVMRKPWAALEKNGDFLFIDRNGKVLYPIEDDFTVFVKAANISTAAKEVAEQDLWKVAALKEIEESYNYNNLQKHFNPEIVVFTSPNEISIQTDKGTVITKRNDISNKFRLLKTALEECEKNRQGWYYIDIRFEYPYVKHGKAAEDNERRNYNSP